MSLYCLEGGTSILLTIEQAYIIQIGQRSLVGNCGLLCTWVSRVGLVVMTVQLRQNPPYLFAVP